MTDLGSWLAERGYVGRALGVQDCCTLPSDWAVAAGFADPMATWRGAYSTAEGAQSFIADAGGLLALFERGFAAIPRREGEPRRGDVGVIKIGEFEAGAIFADPRWAFVGERGIGMASVDPECIAAVWAVGG